MRPYGEWLMQPVGKDKSTLKPEELKEIEISDDETYLEDLGVRHPEGESVECCCCKNYFIADYEWYDDDYHHCGGSPRCCP